MIERQLPLAVTIKKKMVYAPLVQLLRGKGYTVSLAADGGIHTMVFGASGTTTTHVREALFRSMLCDWQPLCGSLVRDTGYLGEGHA
jgi:hypothetical protein